MAESSAPDTPKLPAPDFVDQGLPLYDFLYRDANRIASFYAQLFGGRLSSVQEATSQSQASEREGGVNFHVASGSAKSSGTITDTSTRFVDPHDLVATDVLSRLMAENHVSGDILTAPHGGLCHVFGTVVFADKSLTEMGIHVMDAILAGDSHLDAPEVAHGVSETQLRQGLRYVRDLLTHVAIPSSFLLQSDGGVQIVGTLKDDGMEEPISTYYFKHGADGLPGVHMLGIKEVSAPEVSIPESPFLGGMRQSAKGLRDLLFPAEALRVTPIAIFREL